MSASVINDPTRFEPARKTLRVKRSDAKNPATLYCGPTVIALVTGKSDREVLRRVNAFRAREATASVSSMWDHELVQVIRGCGLRMWPTTRNFGDENDHGHITLAAWCREARRAGMLDSKRIFIVCVTSHYLIIRGRKMFDSRWRDGQFQKKAGYRRARVRRVWEVTR